MPYERTIEIGIVEGVIVRLSQSGTPIERYSVVLLAFADGNWETIRVYDNHRGTHHMHRYTQEGGKQPEAPFYEGRTNEAIPAAIAHLKAHWEAIIESWKS
ncbi:MAG TPA: hypothetical protein VKB23_00560 [Solirubrobacterales bacterium]|nr:hypothetical protein [Solirubrobacterales bacterium]